MCLPRISIIVPVYKAEKTIEKCVNSILAQTFTDFELILVDDGSPDICGSICDTLAQKDERIPVIHKENGGVSSARNAGLEIAKGKYLMFCDSDDYVSPEWCEWLCRAIESGNVHMAVCGVESFDYHGNKKFRGIGSQEYIAKVQFVEMASRINLFELWNKIFLAETVRKNNLRFDERISRCEDALFVLMYLQLIDNDGCFCYGSPALYHYNMGSDDSLSKKHVENYWEIEKTVLDQTLAVFKLFGVEKEEYIEFYSEKAALALSGVITNLINSKEISFAKRYRKLKEIVISEEYEAGVCYGGMDKVTSGIFLCLLKQKCPAIICLYCTLSNVKNKFIRRERF